METLIFILNLTYNTGVIFYGVCIFGTIAMLGYLSYDWDKKKNFEKSEEEKRKNSP